MRRTLLLTTAALLSIGAVAAQDIPVRSGEHADFTRFVFYLPNGVSASASRRDGAIRVNADLDSAEFDLSVAFDRIARRRVSDAVPRSGAAVDLVLACDCGIETFRTADNLFVVDVTDAIEQGPILSYAPDIGSAAARFAPLARTYLTYPVEASASGEAMAAAPAPASNVPRASDTDIAPQPLPDMTDPAVMERQARVREAEQRLLEQLAKAASQGLLQTSENVPAREAASASRGLADADAATAQKVANKNEAGPKHAGPQSAATQIDAETSIDRDYRAARAARAPVTSDGEACFEEDMLSVRSWGGHADFGTELGRLRAMLYDASAAFDPAAARELARFYIHHGFGAEARSALAGTRQDDVQSRALLSMARIAERGHEDPPGAFHGQIDCDSPAALWAALSHESFDPGLNPNQDAILRAFNGLPVALRRHFGPTLANRFLAAGDRDMAERLLELVDRGVAEPDAAQELASARIDLARGERESAEASLTKVAEDNDGVSPAALVSLIDSHLESDTPIPTELMSLAEAYAVELRGQPLAVEVERVLALGMGASGQHKAALDRIDRLRDVPGFDWAAARSQVARMIARDAGDLQVLGFAARLGAESPETLTAQAANEIGSRLANLGFGALAMTFLAEPAEGEAGRERRLVRARIALDQQLPRRAEAELLGLEGPETARLRAEARAMSGDHEGASREFSRLDDHSRAIREAWRAGNWAEVAESDEGPFAAAAALMSPPDAEGAADAPAGTAEASSPQAAETAETAGVLARNRALLERSASSRQTLDELLDSIRVGSPGSGGS